MKPHVLRIIDGPEKGREFEIADNQELVVGRGAASDTKINDPRVSRIHCRVMLKDGNATVMANEGAGATLVQGHPIDERKLQPGEVFRIGDTFIRLDDGDTEHVTLGSEGPRTEVQPTTAVEKLIGTSFAHYRLDAIIATGNTGMVFKATDTKEDRPAAVKVLLPRVSSTEEQRDRFVRAMKTMLPIKHPNIIPIYHAGKQGKFCWIAMEYIDGEAMDNVIARIGVRNMLDWRQVWEVAIDIGRALQCAGQHRIIHRHLAPANIICRASDKVNLLGDLMLAKATEGDQSFDVTSPGQLVGDIAYMSPERTASTDAIDARSDIYELGATLYALLTGRPPFEATSIASHISMIRNQVPTPPKEYQISINDMFQDIVMTMLAKRPDDRFESADGLLTDLERVGRFAGLTRK